VVVVEEEHNYTELEIQQLADLVAVADRDKMVVLMVRAVAGLLVHSAAEVPVD
jgi:hypothetical protein